MQDFYMKSPVGFLHIVEDGKGIRELTFEGETPGREETPPGTPLLEKAREELTEYFAGKRKEFSLPLSLQGTEFQRKVWEALLEIPYGEIRTYGQIAERIGREKAFRAVGMANHANPVAIVVPCHRVIGSDGNLTGYGGGLDKKRFLLELEARNIRI